MESIFNTLKNFILLSVNTELEKIESEDLELKQFTNKNIFFGVVDISKNNLPLICSILPEYQNEVENDEIDSFNVDSKFTITFIFQSDKYENLVKKMCRYGLAFRNAVLKDDSIKDNIIEIQLGERKFHSDCGASPLTVTAFESEIDVITENEIKIGD